MFIKPNNNNKDNIKARPLNSKKEILEPNKKSEIKLLNNFSSLKSALKISKA